MTAAGTPSTGRRKHRPDDGRLARGRRSRERVREAARALFRERGFEQATLRAIAERAGMGASSIYRHFRSKEELLVAELMALQEEAWTQFRLNDDPKGPVLDRIGRFFEEQQALLVENADFTRVAIRATTHPEPRVAKRALALQDRSIGLLAEVLQRGRAAGHLGRNADVLTGARVLFYAAQGLRLAWANGSLTAPQCQKAIEDSVVLLFQGLR